MLSDVAVVQCRGPPSCQTCWISQSLRSRDSDAHFLRVRKWDPQNPRWCVEICWIWMGKEEAWVGAFSSFGCVVSELPKKKQCHVLKVKAEGGWKSMTGYNTLWTHAVWSTYLQQSGRWEINRQKMLFPSKRAVFPCFPHLGGSFQSSSLWFQHIFDGFWIKQKAHPPFIQGSRASRVSSPFSQENPIQPPRKFVAFGPHPQEHPPWGCHQCRRELLRPRRHAESELHALRALVDGAEGTHALRLSLQHHRVQAF